jgi:hypothetical protein
MSELARFGEQLGLPHAAKMTFVEVEILPWHFFLSY